MYFLLIAIHAIFIFLCHILGYYLLEGVFVVLLLFFLLYFSPIFFFKKEKEIAAADLFSLEFSPQKSLLIPLILTYFGIYLLAFTFSGGLQQSIQVHIMIFLAIYVVIMGYIFAFIWKNDVFFEVTRFHLIFSYITLFAIGIYFFFYPYTITILEVVFCVVVGGFSVFFFSYEKKERREVFHFFLLAIFFILEILILFMFPNTPLYVLVGSLGIFSIFLFEYSRRGSFFESFLVESRTFSLSFSILSAIVLVILSFFTFESIYFLIPLMIFFFSVHTRFSNVVAYGAGIFVIYFLYAQVFFSLISPASLSSTLTFIFFFPLAVILNTYFWEERYHLDFMIIHYSSIAFSALFFLYALIFIPWEGGRILFTSFSTLLLALLFTLSYFRFHKKDTPWKRLSP